MSILNLKEGDYLLIGETVTVHFDYKTGRNEMLIAIDAPEDVPVLRSKIFERQDVGVGDRLEAERRRTRRSAYAGRARRDEQERRMAAGEIRRYNE